MDFTRRRFMETTAAAASLSAAPFSVAQATALQAQMAGNGPSWRKRSMLRKPNILMVILDDVGFADFGCYGSEIATPCIDRLAQQGVRFNEFHVTALCAPTRACLLSGRNAHAVGVGNIAEWGREYPGYRGWIRESVPILPEILRTADYNTFAIGKWHLSMVNDQDATGPFDHWPVHRGFDHWYGFHGSAVDHFYPELFRGTAQVYPERRDDYHLTEDLIDQTIGYIQDHLAAAPERPFFGYVALGACHFPVHAPQSYLEQQRGRYDRGWDVVRAERFARQKALGLIPSDTILPPTNPNAGTWDSLSDGEQRYALRTQEAYAAMLQHTDDQLQRLVDFLSAEGKLADTILMVMSDNGAAGVGPREGRHDVRRNASILPETTADRLKFIDQVGTFAFQGIYGPGWAQASNTPLKLYKGDTYNGGIKAPLIMAWGNGELAQGTIVPQYHHAIDMLPTLLELIDYPEGPGSAQEKPLDGISMAYALDHPSQPTRKHVQYFETSGDRAIWRDGWKAVASHTPGTSFDEDRWELYHTATDFSEVNDLSKQYPALLASLIDLWDEEARRNDVLPLGDDLSAYYKGVLPHPREHYVFYPGGTRLNRLSAPDLAAFDFDLRAVMNLADEQGHGVLLAMGDSMAGYELVMDRGVPVFHYVYVRDQIHRLRSTKAVPKGQHILRLSGRHIAGGTECQITMLIDDLEVGTMNLPAMWPLGGTNAGMRCGENRGAPISLSYTGTGQFTRKLEKVEIALDL
ncbi:MAG: arylsulfatase [Parvularcula sp.]|jgi:arylsulfatase|nr:arylsulfatase [Parvularcula sp.]